VARSRKRQRRGRAYAQRPCWCQPQTLYRTFGYRYLLQHATGFFKIDASGIGQTLATRIALQQTRAELRFQLGDIFSTITADISSLVAAEVKLPLSTTATNVSMPRNLSILQTPG
jgi:hypothetical protein